MKFLQFGLLLQLTLLAACVPATSAMPTATTSFTPTPTSTPPATATLTPTPATGQPDQVQRIPSPEGRWTALVNKAAGSLDLEGPDGETFPVFPPGSTVDTVEWSPDGWHLLIVRPNWERSETGPEIQVHGPIEIWQVRLKDGQPGIKHGVSREAHRCRGPLDRCAAREEAGKEICPVEIRGQAVAVGGASSSDVKSSCSIS
jgi:hypothetical protein